MKELTKDQIDDKVGFIDKYINSVNASTGSLVDSNANITNKNIATLANEMYKFETIQVHRRLMTDKITELFGKDLADEYLRQLKDHEIYCHDESTLNPYCVAISMFPMLWDGMKELGLECSAPKHLSSFAGSFCNLLFAVSSQYAGACATAEVLMYFAHFAIKDYGKDYLKTNKREVDSCLQQIVYTLNQPACARGYQSVFWNVSIFDRNFYKGMFDNFVFPDGTKVTFEEIDALQRYFISWLREERTKALLTFPVITAAMLQKDNDIEDQDFARFCAEELHKGSQFFVYLSDSVDSLSSCCRLRSQVSDNTFSHTLGAGGVATGSINVITMNMNRIIQTYDLTDDKFKTIVNNIQKYQVAYRKIMEDFLKAKLLPVYDAHFITMDKQYLTLGINGMVEAAEFLGLKISNNDDYKNFLRHYLGIITEENKKAKQEYGYMFNTEFVPAENLGVKNSKWDKKAGLKVNRDCYNSYFYVVEDDDINIIDKFVLHGKEINRYLDGGSALHLNLEEHLTVDGYLNLFKIACATGCNFFTTNVKGTICNKCGRLDKRTLDACPHCGSKDVDYYTRIIGYVKRVSSFSAARQEEEGRRVYHRK